VVIRVCDLDTHLGKDPVKAAVGGSIDAGSVYKGPASVVEGDCEGQQALCRIVPGEEGDGPREGPAFVAVFCRRVVRAARN
jgi:hypothetical protein